jgi:DNA-binding transcriptional LysR family regulator
MAAEHPLAGRASIGLEELSEEPWLLPEVGGTCADSNIVLRACRDAGFEPDVRLSFDDYPALQGMAAAGVGIALIPSLSTANIRSDVAVRPLRGRPPYRRIGAVYEGEATGPLAVMLDCLRDAVRDYQHSAPISAVAAA